jgi:hypothetical protein
LVIHKSWVGHSTILGMRYLRWHMLMIFRWPYAAFAAFATFTLLQVFYGPRFTLLFLLDWWPTAMKIWTGSLWRRRSCKSWSTQSPWRWWWWPTCKRCCCWSSTQHSVQAMDGFPPVKRRCYNDDNMYVAERCGQVLYLHAAQRKFAHYYLTFNNLYNAFYQYSKVWK